VEYDYLDREVLIKTLWGECRGEPDEDKIAVAWVCRRRAAIALAFVQLYGKIHPLYGMGTLTSACWTAWQFSCWDVGDPNLPIIIALDIESDEAASERKAAEGVLNDLIPDNTNLATHYCVIGLNPSWAAGKTPCAQIGRHVFYDLENG
jgi:spore germination cell wall hydrolase CwlJ-like protein